MSSATFASSTLDSASRYRTEIIPNLYLGNSGGFIRCTYLKTVKENSTDDFFNTQNIDGIKTIITVCPWLTIERDYTFSENREQVAASFLEHKVKWIQVGNSIMDHEDSWLPLVHNSSFPANEDSSVIIHAPTLLEFYKNAQYLNHRKAEKVNKLCISQWFAPIFEAIDTALGKGEKVLIHCQAGISRSATITAAYLINRKGMPAKQAIATLKSKRSCVEPNFVTQLEEYEEGLKSIRKSPLNTTEEKKKIELDMESDIEDDFEDYQDAVPQ